MSRRLQLSQLLAEYRPAPSRRRAHAEMVVLSRRSGDVLSRYHFHPGHFTASAFVLTEDRADLLLVHHTKLDRWLQPGGHIEPGDLTLIDAARREVAEETGIADLRLVTAGLFDIDVHGIPAAGGEPHHEHHDLRFLFTAAGAPTGGHGVRLARWVPLPDVASLTTDRSVLRVVEDL